MTRRTVAMQVASCAFAALAVLALSGVGQTAEKAGHHESMQACAKACSDCQRECDMCSFHCSTLLAEGQRDHVTSLRSCQDCATICAAAAQVVARGGPHSGLICDACAKACEHCAKVCEKFPKDEHMKKCAEECRKCQKACQDMAKDMISFTK